MPEGAERMSHGVPPKVIVSRTYEADRTSTSRTKAYRSPRSRTEDYLKDPRSEWTDVEDSPPRRRRKTTRVPSSRSSTSSVSGRGHNFQEQTKGKSGGFLPRLSRILEGSRSANSPRPSTRASNKIHHRENEPYRRSHLRDQSRVGRRRPEKHTIRSHHTRDEGVPRFNPSLLSVLSTMTGLSDPSSTSSSTVTQENYAERKRQSSETSTKQQRMEEHVRSSINGELPNVFDYMEGEAASKESDDQSIASASSSSSHYTASDAGSSDAPDTPSSQSTFPSPTSTRFQSVADLRKRYDVGTNGSCGSGRSYSDSPAPSIRSLKRQPTVSDVPEDDEEEYSVPSMPRPGVEHDTHPPPSSTARKYSRSSDSSPHEEGARRPSIHSQSGHFVDPIYGQHRTFSNSSAQSDQSAYAYHMAMQRYQWPSSPPIHPQAMNGHLAHNERPPAPDPPDFSRRTLVGYEELALELASDVSSVKPLYRKFEYLNHRILLHLQDELSELEEQLRTIDEVIAQMDPATADGSKPLASRRGENFYGHELHVRRTHLLGNIFTKTEQYNRALSAYTSLAKGSSSATEAQVISYQEWMAKHSPIHEIETRYLQHQADLIVPAPPPPSPYLHDYSRKHTVLAYLPIALMLPLLLFSLLPTLAARLVVTALIAIGAFIGVATTRIRNTMSVRDWAICAAVYVLVMAAVAGCVPQHGT